MEHIFQKLNGWLKVILTLIALGAVYGTLTTKLDTVILQNADMKIEVQGVSKQVGNLSERVSRVEGRLDPARTP